MAFLFLNLAINTHNLSRLGLTFTLVHARLAFQVLLLGGPLSLGLVIGGLLRRKQQLRAARISM
jgi:hypothetical protein